MSSGWAPIASARAGSGRSRLAPVATGTKNEGRSADGCGEVVEQLEVLGKVDVGRQPAVADDQA